MSDQTKDADLEKAKTALDGETSNDGEPVGGVHTPPPVGNPDEDKATGIAPETS